MKKLPPNARRVIVFGYPCIEHTDPVTGKIRVTIDEATIKARKPVNARYAKPKTRVVPRAHACKS